MKEKKMFLPDQSALNKMAERKLIIDFKYTNKSKDSKDFINDSDCNVLPFQNGIELETSGTVSEEGVFDYSEAFTLIKKGASIKTQLVWELRDTKNPVEIEFGWDDVMVKTLKIIKK
jgi:hypothetical protein